MSRRPDVVAPPAARRRARPATVGEPRWPAVLAVLSVGVLHYSLPDTISMGPPWLLLAVVCVLIVPTTLAHRTGHSRMNEWLGHAVGAVITAALVYALARLVLGLAGYAEPARALLRSAALLWLSNVLVFASWYWRLDAGGPNGRDHRRRHGLAHRDGAFLFPQMALEASALGRDAAADGAGSGAAELVREAATWSPQFVDYLFLAFTTSTAFSPTDTPVLSRWAKLLMMVQASIALTSVAVLAARAVNII